MPQNSTLILNRDTFYSIPDEEKKRARRIIVEDGVTSLDVGAFVESQSLEEVFLPDTLTDLGIATFMNCHNLKHINIPSGIKVIDRMTFWRCSSLTEIELPDGIEEIYLGAFWGCCNLAYINLPETVKSIATHAFGGCKCIDQVIHDYPHLIRHANVGDYKINDLIDIFKENPDNADFFDLAHDLKGWEWVTLLTQCPELSYRCPWRRLTGSDWAKLLIEQPQFADWCPWYKLTDLYLVDLLKHQGQLAEKCRWDSVIPSCQTEIAALLPHLSHFCNWEKISVRKLFRDYKVNLSQYKLEYISTPEIWHEMMETFYSDRSGSYKGIFADGVEDVATYMIFKAMDKANAKLFLKCQFECEAWDFLEELCDISPEELTHVPGKNKMPFYIALNAPDNIFYKFFQSGDQHLRDKAGNSVLFPALVHDLLNNGLNRFEFLCQKGFDPDEKNLAGFSCNDMIKHYSKKG